VASFFYGTAYYAEGDFMDYSMTRTKPSAKMRSLVLAAGIGAAIGLPLLFHALGAVSGLGSALGASFLPMHLGVLLAGLLGGPLVGLCAGLASPLISFALSGMPAATMLPMMTVELAGYGLVSGLLYRTRMPTFAKLLLAQLAGRGLRAAFILLAIYGFGSTGMQPNQIWTAVIAGVPGILLQWAFVPLMMYRIEGMRNHGK
jgi:hypothetical protein